MQPPSIIADPLLCEAEPIHIPGAIQPHGVLLALSGPARRILHASLSTMDWLGIPADRLLGRDLVTALGPELADAVNAALAQPSASHEYETTRPFEWTPATGYARTYEIQWQNFASWLIAGALVVNGAALVCALLALLPGRRTAAALPHFVLLLATWIVGFFNALMHARDAWASMPGGLVLSVITVALGLVATFFAARAPRIGGVE